MAADLLWTALIRTILVCRNLMKRESLEKSLLTNWFLTVILVLWTEWFLMRENNDNGDRSMQNVDTPTDGHIEVSSTTTQSLVSADGVLDYDALKQLVLDLGADDVGFV